MRQALFAIVFSLSIAVVLGFGKTPETPDTSPAPEPTYEDYDYDPQADVQRVGGGSCPIARYDDTRCASLEGSGLEGGFYETWITTYNCETASFTECADNREKLYTALAKNEKALSEGKTVENDRNAFWPAHEGPFWGITKANAEAMFGTRTACQDNSDCDVDKYDAIIKPIIDHAEATGGLVSGGADGWNGYEKCNWYRPKVYTKRYDSSKGIAEQGADREDVCMTRCNGCLTPEERLPGAWKHDAAPLQFVEYEALGSIDTQREFDALYRCVPCRQEEKQMIHRTGQRYTDCFPEQVLDVGVTTLDDDPNIGTGVSGNNWEDVYDCNIGGVDKKCKRLDRRHMQPNTKLSQFPGDQWFSASLYGENRQAHQNPIGSNRAANTGSGWKKGENDRLQKWLKCPFCGERGNPESNSASTWFPSEDAPYAPPSPPLGEGCPEFCRTSPEKRIGCAGPQYAVEGTDPFCIMLSAPTGEGYTIGVDAPIKLGSNLADCSIAKIKQYFADHSELDKTAIGGGNLPNDDARAQFLCGSKQTYVRVLSATLNEDDATEVGDEETYTHVQCVPKWTSYDPPTLDCGAGTPDSQGKGLIRTGNVFTGITAFTTQDFYTRLFSCPESCYNQVPAGRMPDGVFDGTVPVNPGAWPGPSRLASPFTRDPAFNLYRQFDPIYWPAPNTLTTSQVYVRQTSEKCNTGALAYANTNHIQSREHRRDNSGDNDDNGKRLCESSWYPLFPTEARTNATFNPTKIERFRRCEWHAPAGTNTVQCRRRSKECSVTKNLWDINQPPAAPSPPSPPPSS